MKVYTDRSIESVVNEFSENFKVRELCNTTSEPSFIENDLEPGVEFMMVFYGVSPNPPIILKFSDDKNDCDTK